MCLRTSEEVDSFKRHWEGFVIHMPKVWRKSVKHSKRKQLTEFRVNTEFWHRTRSLKSLSRSLSNINLFIYLLFARNHQCDNHMQASMRQDSETNIIVLNTALKYKIQRITHTQNNSWWCSWSRCVRVTVRVAAALVHVCALWMLFIFHLFIFIHLTHRS